MRADASPLDTVTPACPLCTHLNSHTLSHTVAAACRPAWLARCLSPLLTRLPHPPRSWSTWSTWSSCWGCPRGGPRLPFPPHRHGGGFCRWILLLLAVTLFTMLVASYVTPHHAMGGPGGSWLAMLRPGGSERGPGGKKRCTLVCPNVAPDDPDWTPSPRPIASACNATATLPVPCSVNVTHSELLKLPPIRFLKNFHNPCWYEPTPPASSQPHDLNLYRNNLYPCFSHAAQTAWRKMAHQPTGRREQGDEKPRRRLRCLPHFYIAGMPKCGSTDLFRKVMIHPDVSRPPMKEPHYWGKNRFGQRLNFSSSVALQDYVDLFDPAAIDIERRPRTSDDVTSEDDDVTVSERHDTKPAYHPVVTVDASASTFWNNDEWWRLPENCGRSEPLFTNAHYIRRLTPQAKILVILRNPTERLYSDYLYFTKENKSVSMFHGDVIQSIAKMTACTRQKSLRSCVYDKRVTTKVRLRVGLYHIYLSEWLRVFPREQLLVLRTEDYSKDVRRTARRVYKFLGLRSLTETEAAPLEEMPIANTRKTKDKRLGAMWDSTRRALQDFYRAHNTQLSDLLADPRFLWRDVTVATPPDNVTVAGGGSREEREGREWGEEGAGEGEGERERDVAGGDGGGGIRDVGSPTPRSTETLDTFDRSSYGRRASGKRLPPPSGQDDDNGDDDDDDNHDGGDVKSRLPNDANSDVTNDVSAGVENEGDRDAPTDKSDGDEVVTVVTGDDINNAQRENELDEEKEGEEEGEEEEEEDYDDGVYSYGDSGYEEEEEAEEGVDEGIADEE